MCIQFSKFYAPLYVAWARHNFDKSCITSILLELVFHIGCISQIWKFVSLPFEKVLLVKCSIHGSRRVFVTCSRARSGVVCSVFFTCSNSGASEIRGVLSSPWRVSAVGNSNYESVFFFISPLKGSALHDRQLELRVRLLLSYLFAGFISTWTVLRLLCSYYMWVFIHMYNRWVGLFPFCFYLAEISMFLAPLHVGPFPSLSPGVSRWFCTTLK